MSVIKNASSIPLNQNSGTVPDVSGALLNWQQPMIFGVVEKSVEGFQSVEVMEEISFMGVWQPLSGKRLMMKPEGQQAWSWYWLHTQINLELDVDMVVIYIGVQYRVMSKKHYKLYGYFEYEFVEDYTGSGPAAVTP